MAKAFGSAAERSDESPREKSATERANESKELYRKAAAHKAEMEGMVADLVVRQIAHPPGFLRVDAHHLFADRFRVNVLASKPSPDNYGEDRSIPKSFFVQSDGVEIVESIPPLA